MTRLWHLARGQVRVRVMGASLPRFLNLCATKGLTLRRMERTAWDEMYATLSVADFRALRRYMGRTGCRVHIVQRRGAPFLAARLRPRTALWGGCMLLVLLCWVLCAHIWSIEARISPALDEAEVMQQLEELGVHVGARISGLDTRSIRWKMLSMQPNMTFLSLNIRGNSLTIEAYGVTPPKEKIDQEAVVKVVAAREGVVKSVKALEGQPMVQAGDAVETGDTLISGLVSPTREGGNYRLAHARGEVEAYTVHHVTTARALETESKTYTGKIKRQFALVLGNHRLNLYIGSGIDGGTCDKIIETRTLRLSDSVVFPVSLVVQTYVFYERQPQTDTVEEVRVEMLSRSLEEIASGMDGTVTAHSETLAEQNGAAVLDLTVHAVEQIGVEAVDDSTIPEQPPTEEEAGP